MMKRSRLATPDRRQAEELAIQALLFVTESEQRLSYFLNDTGVSPGELRDQAGEPGMLAAILEHLLRNEFDLLVFAAGAGIEPQMVEPMRALLAGEKKRWEPST